MGNQNKTLAESNPMRIEQKTKEDDAKIEFNKFGFITGNEASASGGLVAADADKAKGKTKLSGKVNQDTLRAAEGLQKRIKYLEKTNPEEATKLKKDHAWDKALAQSEGKKVQDILKKFVKRCKIVKDER